MWLNTKSYNQIYSLNIIFYFIRGNVTASYSLIYSLTRYRIPLLLSSPHPITTGAIASHYYWRYRISLLLPSSHSINTLVIALRSSNWWYEVITSDRNAFLHIRMEMHSCLGMLYSIQHWMTLLMDVTSFAHDSSRIINAFPLGTVTLEEVMYPLPSYRVTKVPVFGMVYSID